mmetsp:Transcript_13498/g.13566  ORF Transcript_13498/g.13566 Transcript_13498/m.13566 type:complete len:134 (+) Transcript_13498:24-425(+)
MRERERERERNVLRLPKLALWYKNDFGPNISSQISTILSLLSTEHKKELLSQMTCHTPWTPNNLINPLKVSTLNTNFSTIQNDKSDRFDSIVAIKRENEEREGEGEGNESISVEEIGVMIEYNDYIWDSNEMS